MLLTRLEFPGPVPPVAGLPSELRLSVTSLLRARALERSKTISSLGRNSYYRVPTVQAQTCKNECDSLCFYNLEVETKNNVCSSCF